MYLVSRLFAVQDGLATFDQLRRVGVSDSLRRQRLASGEWEHFDRVVVGLAGAPVTWRRHVRAALLSAGDDAAISHATAARLHGFDGFAHEQTVHVTVCGSTHYTPLPGTTFHRSTLLTADGCTEIDGMRVVSKPIALLQIAGTRRRDATRQALDGLLRDGESPEWIRQTVQQWRRPGVKGPAPVLDLLSETERRLPRSWFQRLAKRVVAVTGLQLMDEYPVTDPDTGRLLAELDLAAPELMIGIECQSWKWHSTPSTRAAGALRKRRLRRLGWEIIELWWVDLARPTEVLADVTHAVALRRAVCTGGLRTAR